MDLIENEKIASSMYLPQLRIAQTEVAQLSKGGLDKLFMALTGMSLLQKAGGLIAKVDPEEWSR